MLEDQVADMQKTMNLFIKETRDNFSRVFEDRQNDADKMDDIYRKIASLSADVELLRNEIEQHTKTVKKETKETQEAIAGGVEAIEENLMGKTKIIVKEVGKKKNHWWQIWRR